MMYIFHIFLFLISPLPLYSAEILNCTELGNTYIGFDRNKGLFETSGEIKDRKNSKVTFVIEKDKGFIK